MSEAGSGAAGRAHTEELDGAGEDLHRRVLALLSEQLVGVLDPREVGARAACVLVPEHADACVVFRTAGGVDEPRAAGSAPDLEVLHDGDSIADELRTVAEETVTGGRARAVAMAGHVGRATPLVDGGRCAGVLVLVDRSGRADRLAWHALADAAAERLVPALVAASRHEELRVALERRDGLLAMLSHDLRNALGSASLNCQLLQRVGHGEIESYPTGQRRLAAIRRAVDWMSDLVEDLLDKRALEQGQVVFRIEPLGADQLCREVADLNETGAGQRGISIVVDAPAGVSTMTDHGRAFQVLDNLVANAVAASPDESTIVVHAEPSPQGVLFSVRDSGPGIPREGDPSELFHDGLRRKEVRGRARGMGLPIAYSLVRAMGGRLWLESPPGGGSLFLFTLPAAGSARPV